MTLFRVYGGYHLFAAFGTRIFIKLIVVSGLFASQLATGGAAVWDGNTHFFVKCKLLCDEFKFFFALGTRFNHGHIILQLDKRFLVLRGY